VPGTNTIGKKKTTYAAVVGMKKCKGLDHLLSTLDQVLKVGGEGLMLREPRSKYVQDRTNVLLKVKTFHDEEAKVTGHRKGEGRLMGLIGAIECVLPNGKEFSIGTGFSDHQRKHPPKIGEIVTFKYQELSDNGHPRFPVFIRVRKDITWEDVLKNAKENPPASSKQKVIPILKKEHTLLFSTVPSRDNSGNKIVTDQDAISDDEIEEKKR